LRGNIKAVELDQPAEGNRTTYVKGLGRASGLRGLGLRPRRDPYHELRPLPLGAHALVVVEDAVAPRALQPANVVEPEAPRLEDPELALVAAVRALDQAVPRSLPVSLALKRFQPGLKGPEVITLLRRITTALDRALPQLIREARQRTRTCNRFSGPKTRFKACRRDLYHPYGGKSYGSLRAYQELRSCQRVRLDSC